MRATTHKAVHDSGSSISRGTFRTIADAEASRGLSQLLAEVSAGFGRIEIVGTDGSNPCVLLSKTELQSLEDALAILSGTSSAEEMREEIQRIVVAARVSALAPAVTL